MVKLELLSHPRPQLYRKNWKSLNGEWDFKFGDESDYNLKINVPYSYQTESSGLAIKEIHNVVWYRKKINFELIENELINLNFEAVDYKTNLWINGVYVGDHTGGYIPFTFEISKYLKMGENEIVIRVEDYNKTSQVIGKQSWKNENFLCWYTKTIGIWQDIWIERVNKINIEELKMTPNLDKGELELDIFTNNTNEKTVLQIEIFYKNEFINSFSTKLKNDRTKLSVDVTSNEPNFRLHYWTPNEPNLYDIKFTLVQENKVVDEIKSYFGMRKVEIIKNKVFLNNQEFYQKLILDQGYFKKGGLTATVEELKSDVEKIKEMGFNGVRKHQKIEKNAFAYLCDVLGLVMWAELPSCFEYSHISNKNSVDSLHELIKKHYNNPSVIAYTVLNESWGINEVYNNEKQQNFINALFYLVKSLDNTRIVIGNDGWEHSKTDILTIHDYNSDSKSMKEKYESKDKFVNETPSLTSLRNNFNKNYKYSNQPIMISEYGGIAFEVTKYEGAWGYGNRITDPEKVLEKMEELTKVIMDTDYICGFCYTQLSDVEQEINGLLDHNHEYKFSPEKIKKILTYKHNGGFIFL